jgi:hypothetical protein
VDIERSSGTLRFRVTLGVLVAMLVIVPIAAMTFFDLDARTPLTIAQDTLHKEYGLKLVDKTGRVVPMDSSAPTVSEFSVEAGATTKGVPFRLDGRDVRCTVHVATSDPASVTATCG